MAVYCDDFSVCVVRVVRLASNCIGCLAWQPLIHRLIFASPAAVGSHHPPLVLLSGPIYLAHHRISLAAGILLLSLHTQVD
jgi:hypothetical protein